MAHPAALGPSYAWVYPAPTSQTAQISDPHQRLKRVAVGMGRSLGMDWMGVWLHGLLDTQQRECHKKSDSFSFCHKWPWRVLRSHHRRSFGIEICPTIIG